ncbi:MAG TPA: B12-binding domain-containing radical SAM protein [Spirochaetota bacterium]|nr:B12-binding domain-containing radical SAM protein [Spirochaetota bacterium]OPZ37875.1 MAG: Radical SAM superfamily protein [Spirochaetes bacterium ADurb.BinA120]HNU91181.1 B12-binding domain-containing radical SAM protein [Spirochaetota bacterium]HPV97542.1 B12-binding domain-containing radical SAM protein [Spirochaetota bacterium]
MLKRRVLLVYPEIPATYWSFKYALDFVGKKAVLPPLGLITVAAMLPEEWECRLVDMNVEPLEDEAIEWADMVFVSAMLVQRASFEKVVARVGRLGRCVVAGGPYPTAMHCDIGGVDHFVLNEAEATLAPFLRDLEKGKPKRVYSDETRPDIAATPAPRFDLLDIDCYSTASLQFSRGCPFNCEFCDIIEMFGHVPRVKSPGQFLREMDSLYATGFRGPLFIVDDNFIGNKHRVKELLREIIIWQKKYGHPFSLSTEASINLADDDELLELMAEAGFMMVFVGIETPVEESLSLAGKTQNLKGNMLESIRKIQGRGIEVTGGFIIGFDTDPEDIFDRQIGFVRESAIPTAMVGLLMALPNTRLYRRLEAEGRITGLSTGNNTHDVRVNFESKLPPGVLYDGYRRVIREIYGPRAYFDRCLELLRRFPKKKRVNVKKTTYRGKNRLISFLEARALFASLFRQGLSWYGPEYFRFLAKSLFINPSRFPQAVGMAIEGHHFMTMTGEILADALRKARSDDAGGKLDGFRKIVDDKIALAYRTEADASPIGRRHETGL